MTPPRIFDHINNHQLWALIDPEGRLHRVVAGDDETAAWVAAGFHRNPGHWPEIGWRVCKVEVRLIEHDAPRELTDEQRAEYGRLLK